MRSVLPLLLAVSLFGSAHGDEMPVLRFSSGNFHPLERGPETALPAPSASGRLYLVAVTRGPLSPEDRRRLERAGAELLDYVPDRGYRLRLVPAAERDVRALPFVRWLGEVPGTFKIAPGIGARAAGETSDAPLRVVLHGGEPVDRVVAALADLETVASPSGKDGAWRAVVRAPAERLTELLTSLSALPEVEAIELARPMRLRNQDAVWVHQSFVGPAPQQAPVFDRGIYGCGQTVALADSGQDYDHCGFRDTIGGPPPISICTVTPCPVATPATGRRKDILYYNWSGTPTGDDDTCPATITGASGHGTHTSGSIAADSPPYADCGGFTTAGRNGGDGLAPGAKLVVQEMGDGLEYLNGLGGSVWNLADVAFRSGARIHSNSWSGACHDILGTCVPGCTMPYDSFARDADLATWSYPDLLLVMAAGNAGEFCPAPVSVGTPAIAKSPVAVGSVGHGAQAGVPSAFSSRGPVFDGRLKPTLAAQGESTVSPASDAFIGTNNCSTCSLDGSSMSAPTVAGLAALVREYYTAGYYAAGARNPPLGFTPSAALIKATLIDGAVALGADAPAPDFDSGFGRVQLDRTLAFSGSVFALRVVDERGGLVTGGVVTRGFDVAAGTPFRATLVWSDFPAALNAATARVNSLQLEVTDPLGNVWFQTLDPDDGLPRATADAGDAHDALNVEERLVFANPAPGRWIVRVRALDVPWGPQPFALVVRGALTDCPAPTAPAAPMLATPADQQVQVSWAPVAGSLSTTVERSLGGCAANAWVPVATGIAGSSWLDTGVVGGVTYGYRIRAASDAAGGCPSAPSPCVEVVPTGACTLAPFFRGATGASSAGAAACGIEIAWDVASPYCSGAVTYNVYRDIAPGFTPAAANRVARCVHGSSFIDGAGLVPGMTYHYIVRAEDATAGNGGACNDGNEDNNLARVSATPDGPPAVGTWFDDAGDTGTASMVPVAPWTVEMTGGDTGPKVYTAASYDGACADLASPPLTLADPGSGPQLTFRTRHTLDYDPFGVFGAEGSLGEVQIATGPSFGNWTRVPLTPDYPTIVEFPLHFCTAAAAPATYFSGTSVPSGEFSTYTASLANWAGGDVRIRYFLAGDLLYPFGSWWVDDIAVSGALVPQTCVTEPLGPPPVPDGAYTPGQPMRASRVGAGVQITWDASSCPASEVNVYFGTLGAFSTFTGGHCALPPTGSTTVSIPEATWFVLAATDGATTDGSWGRGAAGAERVIDGAEAVCPEIVEHVTNHACP